jgi:riboflavin synthase
MFTGIVESLGRIAAIEAVGGDSRMTFVADSGYLDGVALGDSIAVKGICLTVQFIVPKGFIADLSRETLAATTAASWCIGDAVNLERALTPNKPLGGHLVSGHVDGVGRLLSRHEDARSWRLRFEAPRALAKYIARKGSITIDGVSLTVNDVDGDDFGVNIIPVTAEHTTLGGLQPGGQVNLEVDLIARYLERLIGERELMPRSET